MVQGQIAGVLRQLRKLIDGKAQGDGELLRRFAVERDQPAFAALVERHGPMVLGVCKRVLQDAHEAEDVFQAVFLVLARKARGLDQYGSLGNWLHTVAYRLALKTRARAARRREERQMVDVADSAGAAPWRDLQDVLDGELDRLPPRYRSAVVLCYLEGRTNEEAARELGWPVGTVKVRLARARDLLRDRLSRRGLSLSLGLLSAGLAERAAAAVSPTLLETTTQAAARFAVGNAVAAGSARPALIAEGALQAMFVNKLKLLAVMLLLLGLAGAGAGAWLEQAPAEEPGRSEVAVEAPERPEAATEPDPAKTEPPRAKARNVVIHEALAKPVTLEAIDPNTPLKDALKLIGDRYGVNFLIDDKAFEAIGVAKAGEQPVSLPKMTGVRLSTVLNKLLKQIKGDVYTGTYQVRPDYIEVTTSYHQLVEAGAAEDPQHSVFRVPAQEPTMPREMWQDYSRRVTPVVHLHYDKRPLAEALRDLGEQANIDVVIDPRAAEKARAPVSLTVNNLLFDRAVALLVDMTELDWMWMDQIVYLTTKEDAKARRDRQKALEAEKLRMWREADGSGVPPPAFPPPGIANPAGGPPAPNPAQPPFPPQAVNPPGVGNPFAPATAIDINFTKKPLAEALKELGQAHGFNVVIDPKVQDKAQAPVTLELRGVSRETAFKLLAVVADLRVVAIDKVFYLTTKENAKGLE